MTSVWAEEIHVNMYLTRTAVHVYMHEIFSDKPEHIKNASLYFYSIQTYQLDMRINADATHVWISAEKILI